MIERLTYEKDRLEKDEAVYSADRLRRGDEVTTAARSSRVIRVLRGAPEGAAEAARGLPRSRD